MNFLAERARRVPAVLRFALLAPALGFPIYWGFTYTGPYRWLAEWQLKTWDSYEVLLSGLCPMMVLLFGAGLLIHAAAGFFPEKDGSETASAVTDYIEQHPYPIAFGLVAVGCLLIGGWLLADSYRIGDLTPTKVKTLESGAEPSSRFVDLKGGRFRDAEVLGVQEDTTEKFFVPLSSKAGGPAVVYVQVSQFDWEFRGDELRQNIRQGVLYRNGLPGLVREDFKRAGTLEGEEHWVLEFGESPDNIRGLASILASSGCCLGFAVAIFVVIGVIRRKD
jgi:hypothetical protein